MKSIEINYKTSDSYEVLYPTTIADGVSISTSDFTGTLSTYITQLEERISVLNSGKSNIEVGQYVGTGNDITLTFSFAPKYLYVCSENGYWNFLFGFMAYGQVKYPCLRASQDIEVWDQNASVAFSGNSVTFEGLNNSGDDFYYVAFGF